MKGCKYCGEGLLGHDVKRCHDLSIARVHDAHETHMHRHHELELRVQHLEERLTETETRLRNLEYTINRLANLDYYRE